MSAERSPQRTAMSVAISNESNMEIDPRRISKAVRLAVQGTPYHIGRISVAVVDDGAMRRLNRQFLAHDYATDVLSFSLLDSPPRLEGEIVASADTARRAARRAGWDQGDELLLYVVHGMLHLVGHQDKSAASSRAMRAAERSVLARLGIRTSDVDDRWQIGLPAPCPLPTDLPAPPMRATRVRRAPRSPRP